MDKYRIENVVCYPFRTAILVDNGTIEGQIGEGCQVCHDQVPNGGQLRIGIPTHGNNWLKPHILCLRYDDYLLVLVIVDRVWT